MDIQSTKIELVKTILAIENKDFIQKVAEFIKNEKADRKNHINFSTTFSNCCFYFWFLNSFFG